MNNSLKPGREIFSIRNFYRFFLITAPVIFFSYELCFPLEIDCKFQRPLKIPVVISSTFGEFRRGHFHSGVDLKTGGRTGFEVLAPLDGYIYRIYIDEDGYGKALYLKLVNGLIAIFAHLQAFEDKHLGLEKKVCEWRKNNGVRYPVDIYLPADGVKVKKGEVIGYSGETGAGPPHLHFELRTASNAAIDPLKYLDVTDNRTPSLNALYIEPLTPSSNIMGECWPYRLPVSNFLKEDSGQPLKIYCSPGRYRILVEASDRLGESPNSVGPSVAGIALGDRIFEYDFRYFQKELSRLSPFFFDVTRSSLSPPRYVYRLFNSGIMVQGMSSERSNWDGYIEMKGDGQEKTVRIFAGDRSGNETGREIILAEISPHLFRIQNTSEILLEKGRGSIEYLALRDGNLDIEIVDPSTSRSVWKKNKKIERGNGKIELEGISGQGPFLALMQFIIPDVGKFSNVSVLLRNPAAPERVLPAKQKNSERMVLRKTDFFLIRNTFFAELCYSAAVADFSASMNSTQCRVWRKTPFVFRLAEELSEGVFHFLLNACSFDGKCAETQWEIVSGLVLPAKACSLESTDGKFKVFFPAGSVPQPRPVLLLSQKSEREVGEEGGPPRYLLPEGELFLKDIEISFRGTFDEKDGIYRGTEKKGYYSGGKIRDGWIVSPERTGGRFFIQRDLYPPTLKLRKKIGSVMKGETRRLAVEIREKGEGYEREGINVHIDAERQEFDLSREEGALFVDIPDGLETGPHVLRVQVKDRAGNCSGILEEKFIIVER